MAQTALELEQESLEHLCSVPLSERKYVWLTPRPGRLATAFAALRALVRGGYTVAPHVQAFADACERATGVRNFGTYAGHDPTPQRALDIFHAVGDNALADAICDFFIKNMSKYGGWYIISRQRIYNPAVAPYWRNMADRGSITQNHFDHVHVSFYATASGDFSTPPTTPAPAPEEDWLMSAQGDYVVAVLNEWKACVSQFARYAPEVPGDDWQKGLVGFPRVMHAINERTEADMPKEDSARVLLEAIVDGVEEILARPAGSSSAAAVTPADREAIAAAVVAKVKSLAFRAS